MLHCYISIKFPKKVFLLTYLNLGKVFILSITKELIISKIDMKPILFHEKLFVVPN